MVLTDIINSNTNVKKVIIANDSIAKAVLYIMLDSLFDDISLFVVSLLSILNIFFNTNSFLSHLRGLVRFGDYYIIYLNYQVCNL